MRQVAPLAARSQHIQQGVEHLALAVFTGSAGATTAGHWQQWLNPRPLLVTHIGAINITFHTAQFNDFVYTL